MQRFRNRVHGLAWMTMVLAGGVACSAPDETGPTSLDQSELPWTVTLSAHAITMSVVSPYDTFRVSAVPRNVAGHELPGAPTVTYSTSDSSVRVSSSGLLTARVARNNVKVIASILYHGIRLSDTGVVNVTTVAAPPAFHQVQLALQPGDSTTIAAPNLITPQFGFPSFKTLQTGALDAAGAQIPGSVVAFTLSDPLQASFDPNRTIPSSSTTGSTVDLYILQSSRVGKSVTVYASATVYGVTLRDSLTITVTPELIFIYTLRKTNLPDGTSGVTLLPEHTEVIGVGGYVWWANGSPGDSLDIVFDDPTAASPDTLFFPSGGGNISLFPAGDPARDDPTTFIRARQFRRAGSFHFHSPRTGVSGTVVVQ